LAVGRELFDEQEAVEQIAQRRYPEEAVRCEPGDQGLERLAVARMLELVPDDGSLLVVRQPFEETEPKTTWGRSKPKQKALGFRPGVTDNATPAAFASRESDASTTGVMRAAPSRSLLPLPRHRLDEQPDC